MPSNLEGGQVRGELFLDGEKFFVNLDKAGDKTDKFEKQSKASSRNVAAGFDGISSSIGRTVVKFVSLAAASTAAYQSISKSAELEANFANIATLGDFTAQSIEEVRLKSLELAAEVRKSPVDIAKGYYQAVSAGATHGAEALDLVRQSAILANAGLSDTKTSVDAITNIMNSYGKQNISAAHSADLLIQVVRDGKTTLEEFAPTVGKVANDAASLGIRFEEIAAAAAQLTRTMPTDIAMTALAGALKGLTTSAEDFKKQGIDIYQVIKDRGLVGALDLLEKSTGGSRAKLQELIPDMRAMRGILALTGEQADDYNRILEHMERASGAASTAFSKQSATMKAFGESIKVSTEIMFVKLGDLINRNEAVRTGFKLIADAYRDSVANMSTNTSTLSSNIGSGFIFIVEAGKYVTKTFQGIMLAYKTLALIAANTNAEFTKGNIEKQMFANDKAMKALTKDYEAGRISADQYFKQADLLDSQLDSLKNSLNGTDLEVVKLYKDLEDQANQVEATSANFDRLISRLEKIKDVTSQEELAAPSIVPPMPEEMGPFMPAPDYTFAAEKSKEYISQISKDYDNWLKAKYAAEDREYNQEVALLQQRYLDHQEYQKFLGEQYDIKLQKEYAAEDMAYQNYVNIVNQRRELLISDAQLAFDQNEQFLDASRQLTQTFMAETALGMQDWKTNMIELTSSTMQTFSSSFSSNLSDVIMMTKSAADAAKDFGKSMIKSVVDFAAKWLTSKLVMLAFEKLSMTQQAAAAVIHGKALATAYQEAALFASLASFGANALPASAGIISTAATLKGASIASYEMGGPTVEGPAYVHDKEYVLNQMNSEQLSSVLTDISTMLSTRGAQKVVVSAKDSSGLLQDLIKHLNIAVEDYGVQLTSTRSLR